MKHSQEIALRCASAVSANTLRHRHVDDRRATYAIQFGLENSEHLRRKFTQKFMDILDRCYDDSARRLLIRGIR
jgi:hypothetical protein